jgi:hypothetical protein
MHTKLILFQHDAKSEKNSGYLKVQKDPENSISLMFSLPEKVGALAQVLKIFEVCFTLSKHTCLFLSFMF